MRHSSQMVSTLLSSLAITLTSFSPIQEEVAITSFSSDWKSQTALASADSGLVTLYNLKSGEKIASYKFEKPASTAVVISGTTVAVGQESEVVVYDLMAKREIRRLKKVEGEASYFAVSEDGKRLFAEDFDDGVYCWNLENGLNIKLPDRVHYGGGFFKSKYNKYMLTGWRDDDKCAVWDIELAMEAMLIDGTGKEDEVRDISNNGKFALTWVSDGTLTVYDLQVNKVLKTTKLEYDEDADFYLAPDASNMFLIDFNGECSSISLSSGKKTRLADMDEPIDESGFAYSMDGKYGMLGGYTGVVHVFDMATGKMLWKANATK